MKFSIKTLLYTLLLLSIGCNMTGKEMTKQPNIVYIFPDQFRKHALGFWDSKEFKGAIRTKADPVKTPNLDKFASQALVLTNAVSNDPLCSPHRGSLLSGTFPHISGVSLNCNADRPISSLREDLVCLTDVLHNAGYAQAYFGKWHLDYPTPNDPANPGNYVDPRRPAWDTYSPKEKRHSVDFWYSYGTWDVHKQPHYYDTDGHRYEPKEWSPKHEADMTIKYLKNTNKQRDTSKPFAIFVSMNPPHNPYSSIEDCMLEDYDLYKDKETKDLLVRENADLTMEKNHSAAFYFANVTGVDREFGRIVDELKAMGEYENTIIVFTSDHGETMCSQGTKDAKNSIYTESMDVPFIISYPEMGKAKTDNLLLGSPDIMPTILGLAGLGKMIPETVQGSDYSQVLKGKDNDIRPTSALYIRNVNGNKDDNNKVTSFFPVARGIKTHHYTLELEINRNMELKATKYFNDDKDPYQLKNIAVDKNDPIIQALLKEMAYWLKYSKDPWYKENVLSEWINY